MQIHLNADLQPYHTFSLAQQCQVLVEVSTIDELISVYSREEWKHLPKLMLGKGSNVLFTEQYDGVVIINRLLGIETTETDTSTELHVMGGEDWPDLVEKTVESGWGGLENLALIPGCVGSAPIQNIGAYGVELRDVCRYVDYLDLEDMTVKRLSNIECEFAYRDSIFKHAMFNKAIIVAVGISLEKKWQPKLNYGPLKSLAENCSIQDVYDLICKTRLEKLPDPQRIGNAGSFFKNPVVSEEQYSELVTKFPNVVAYPAEAGMKLAAGWLIDQSGLKGFRIGGAQVHPEQALVLTNVDDASIRDVLSLAQHVVNTVFERYQVSLEHEVRFYGKNQETRLENIEVMDR